MDSAIPVSVDKMLPLELSLGNYGQNISIESIEEDTGSEADVSLVSPDKPISDEKAHQIMTNAIRKAKSYSISDEPIASIADINESCERSSSQSSTHHIPDTIDGGKAEVNELLTLPKTFETALKMNQALQRRITVKLEKLTNALTLNLQRQGELKISEEEQGMIVHLEKDTQDLRDQYLAKPSSFATPFFKDRHGFPAPMNKDAKTKVDLGYLDLYTTKTRSWMVSEMNTLVKVVQEEWKEQSIKKLSESRKDYERKLKKIDTNDKKELANLLDCIAKSENGIKELTDMIASKLDVPRGSDIDWNQVAATAFDGSRNADECRLMWENYMHPDIKKDNFTENEDIFIQQQVLNKYEDRIPDWEAMAKEMDSGRTSFQCMKRWVSFIKPTLFPAKWTAEAAQKLEDTICMLRIGSQIPWSQVTQHLTGFTSAQAQSKWRNINPENIRGQFSTEEDFTMIKGLIKFGLNFELIAHFLPGRTKLQVREKFRRALLNGLTRKPWTATEDKKIMTNCTMASQHWRSMAQILPKREPCEIRLRFYTLHVWQMSSKNKVLPPPLFPLSTTKKPREISEIREKMMKDLNNNVNKFINKIAVNSEFSVRTLEDRRMAIRNIQKKRPEKSTSKKSELKKKKTRKGSKFGPRIPSWPDMALTEFFLPGREQMCKNVVLPKGKIALDHLKRIGKSLHLQLTTPVTDDHLDDFDRLNMVEMDAQVVDEMVLQHSHSIKQQGYVEDCAACNRARFDRPKTIPLIPPNQTTVGAMRSLLFHKQKLKEMATKNFLCFQVPKDQLQKLGNKPNTMISKRKVTDPLSNDPTLSKRQRKATIKVQEKIRELNIVFTNKDKASEKSEGIEMPTASEFRTMLTEAETPHLYPSNPGFDKRKTIAEEDELLFHRFMSLFFWPSIFTTKKPSLPDYHLSCDLVEEVKYKKMEVERENHNILSRYLQKGQFPLLDIKEQESLLKTRIKRKNKTKYVFVNGEVRLVTEQPIRNENVAKYAGVNITTIRKLKKSLLMKKIWENRRNGQLTKKKKGKNIKSTIVPKSKRLLEKMKKRTEESTVDCEGDEENEATV